jgi:pimeloyl-ACP methyl ester carboxylesterase
MSGRLFALLVGIDRYLPPVPALDGCVNDVRAIEELLEKRGATDAARPLVKTLVNEQATRAALIDGFENHLGAAGPEDVALFYYSGHGSQEPTPPEWWDQEPDHLDETLVCHDSRMPGQFDLADKELRALIARLAARNPHILIVLDCCHSGSGTREVADGLQGGKIRRAPTRREPRTLATILPIARNSQAEGRHILLAACREDEEAKETIGDGRPRGVFSWVLTQTLARLGRSPTYRELFQQLSPVVQARAARQSPRVEAADAADLDRPFLGGAIQDHAVYFAVTYRHGAWQIDGGALHGLPEPAGGDTTVFDVFPFSMSLTASVPREEALGTARLTQRFAATSTILPAFRSGAPDPEQVYKAVIATLPIRRLGVRLLGDAEGVIGIRREIAQHGPKGGPSLLVEERSDDAILRVVATPERYRIQRITEGRPLAVDLAGTGASAARTAVDRLEHIARWLRVLELRNPAARLPAGAIALDLFRVSDSGDPELIDPVADAAALRVGYALVDGRSVPAKFKIRITNRSDRKLYCMLLDLPESFGVNSGLLAGNGQWLEPQQEVWARTPLKGSTEIAAFIPKRLVERGVTELKETLKVIASTEECDATVFDQTDLDVAPDRAVVKQAPKAVARNSLQRLMNGKRRALGEEEDADEEALADWITAELTLTLTRPLDSQALPSDGGTVALLTGITLEGPPGFQAAARLGRDVSVTRSADIPALDPAEGAPRHPAWLLDDPSVVTVFELTASRGGEPGLSVLELDEVDAADVPRISSESPLTLRVDRVLADGEFVLPYAFDGEFYLPLGWAQAGDDATEIRIERLPTPLANKRSLKGSIRIFFKKISARVLGTAYEYPILSVVRCDNGAITYVKDLEQIRAGVAAAERIVVYIHGIIGDTLGMATSAFPDPDAPADDIPWMSRRFPLVLAFDYENLNTPIEQTARDLKARLAAVGLGPEHGKELHLVAHSMGGLVSRWFIEVEGGKTIVDRLTMLGTPNGGSPWAGIENMASTLIGIGLNGLAKVSWPPTILGGLMTVVTRAGAAAAAQKDKIQVALGEMHPGSTFLESLAQCPDPAVPYVIIAGNTSMSAASAAADQGRLSRLLARLSPDHLATQLVFGVPNDLAVAVEAIRQVPGPRAPVAEVIEVPCDHVSYFSTPLVLRELGTRA